MPPEAVEKLKKITAKDPNELTIEDIKFLKARFEYLGKNSRAKFAEVLDAETPEAPVEEDDSPSLEDLQAEAEGLGIQTEGLNEDDLDVAIRTTKGVEADVEKVEKEVAKEASYKELKEKAKSLGLKHVAVSAKDLKASIEEAEMKEAVKSEKKDKKEK